MLIRTAHRLLLVATLFAVPKTCAAQGVSSGLGPLSPGSYRGEKYVLDGMVVNAVTGEPIRVALVQVANAAQLTGPDGKFHFQGLLPGQYGIFARKPGYFNEQELSPGTSQNSPIIVGQDMPPVILKLIPESVIYGRITGADGEPLENLPVTVIFSRVINGRKMWQQQGSSQTDEHGAFRIAELRPGTCYLRVGPGQQNVPRASHSDRELEGYAGTYYPGVRELQLAAPIKVGAGEQHRAEFAVQPTPFFRVSGGVVGVPAGVAGLSIQLLNRDGGGSAGSVRYDTQTHGFLADMVPAGTYILQVFVQDPATSRALTARTPLTVRADMANVPVVLAQPTTIPVTVRSEFNRAQLPSGAQLVYVQLEEREPLFPSQAASTLEGPPGNQTLAVRNVAPGIYRAEITPAGPWYVYSARRGDVDLLRENLTVASGGLVEPIEVVVRDDFTTLRGRVSSHGGPVTGAVLLTPVLTPRMAKLAFAASDGTFTVGGLTPGEYLVLAVDQVDEFEYTNPEAVREYSAGMQTIRLFPNQQGSVSLELQHRDH